MRVGLLGEGETDVAVLRGLVRGACPGAETIRGEFRGRTRKRRRRELRDELAGLFRGQRCACALDLVDANEQGWLAAADRERASVPDEHAHLVAVGAPDRNIECWLSADPDDLARETGCDADTIRRAREGDPKGDVQAAFRRAAADRGRDVSEVMTEFAAGAPLATWMAETSFEAFWDECRQLAGALGCDLPNPRDAKERRPASP